MARDKETEEYLASWTCGAGLHFLRVVHPLKAEHDFAQTLYVKQKLHEMAASGKIAPEDTYNTVRPSVTGVTRNVTILPREGAGRSWPGPIPEQFAECPTIEVPEVPMGSTHIVRGVVEILSRETAADMHDTYRLLLSQIDKSSEVQVSISDLNVMAPQPATPYAAKFLAQEASMLMETLDQVSPVYKDSKPVDPDLIQSIWKEVSKRYAFLLIDSHDYSTFLVAFETIRSALPGWVLGTGLPPFVCGQITCGHRLCATHRNRIYQSTPMPAILGASLGFRDVLSYSMRHKVSLEVFLNAVLSQESGGACLYQGAERIRDYCTQLREALRVSETVINFYHCHFLNFASARAAQMAYQKLADAVSPDSADKPELEFRSKEMEESAARSGAALLFDFQNSCQQSLKSPRLAKAAEKLGNLAGWLTVEGIDRYRDRFRETAKESETAAELELDKSLYNEALFPPYWENYVRGISNDLPSKK